MMSERIISGISKHWSVFAAIAVFFGSLWLASKIHKRDISDLKSGVAKVELRIDESAKLRDQDRQMIADRLRSIELNVIEIGTIVRQAQKNAVP